MTTSYYSRHLATLLISRKVGSGVPTSKFTRGLADQAPYRSSESSTHEHRVFNLKKLGATPTVRIVVYGALGFAATVETTFWCSWLWSKAFKRDDDGREQ